MPRGQGVTQQYFGLFGILAHEYHTGLPDHTPDLTKMNLNIKSQMDGNRPESPEYCLVTADLPNSGLSDYRTVGL